MICKNCGKEIEDGVMFCPFCGSNVNEEEAVSLDPKDIVSTALCVVSVLFPIVGLVLFLGHYDEHREVAKKYGIFALIGVAVFIIFVAIISNSISRSIPSFNNSYYYYYY